MAELARLTSICRLRRAGNSHSDIIKTTVYAKTTVYGVIANCDATGGVERSHHSPRKNRKRTKTFLPDLKRSIKADPSQPANNEITKKNAILPTEPSAEQSMKTLRGNST